MGPYIFGKRNTIHIIDIRETVKGLLRAKKYIAQLVSGGADVLFVGTKRQARQHIRHHAKRVNMPFVTERWLGGTLTNFRTIRSRLERLEELEAAEADGTALEYSKKMIASRTRELRKIRRNLEGIRGMDKLPATVVIIDVHRERNAVREAKKLGIPTICLIDTDSDPDYADLPIPGNDDAMRSIETILAHLADAVEEGLKGRTEAKAETEEPRGPRRPPARPAAERPPGPRAPEGGPATERAEGSPPTPEQAGSTVPTDGADPPNQGLAPATATEPEVSK